MNLDSPAKNLIIKLLGSYNKMPLKIIIKVRIFIVVVGLGLILINFDPISLPNHMCFFSFFEFEQEDHTTRYG